MAKDGAKAMLEVELSYQELEDAVLEYCSARESKFGECANIRIRFRPDPIVGDKVDEDGVTELLCPKATVRGFFRIDAKPARSAVAAGPVAK